MGKLDGVCQLLGPYAFYVVAVRVEEGEGGAANEQFVGHTP